MIEINPSEIIPGIILHTSWGYDMTHNDYCKVIENTGKTLKCIMIGSKDMHKDSYAYGAGEETPDPTKEYGKPFRVRIMKDNGYTYLAGSYPYCAGYGNHTDTSKRSAHWWPHKGGANYYNIND